MSLMFVARLCCFAFISTSLTFLPGAAQASDLQVLIGAGPRLLGVSGSGCDPEDVPDSPARLVRRADGMIVLYAAHFRARADVGPDLDHLVHRCDIAYAGHEDADSRAFDARAWLAALWTENGTEVAALVHNEYQAHRFPGRCAAGTYLACWYSFLTLAESRDGAAHFERAAPGVPLVAPNTLSEDGQGRPRGFFGSSNLVRLGDHVYSITMTTGDGAQERGNCLLRAQDPFRPDGWEILTGEGWVRVGNDPYRGQPRPPCATLRNLHGDVTGLVRHRDSGLFVATYIMPGGPSKGAVSYSVSPDLIAWSAPRPIVTLPTPVSGGCQRDRYLYPVIVDPQAQTRSFEDVGSTAELVMLRADIEGCSRMTNRRLVTFDLDVALR